MLERHQQYLPLTTGLDTIVGTAPNSTVQGSFADTIQQGDSIKMVGTGNTFNWFGTYDDAKVPLRIEGVQTINYFLATDLHLDWSFITKAATGVQLFRILNATALSGKTITTSAGQTVSLATGNGNVGTAGDVTWAASATDTTANLILAGYQGASGATLKDLTITGAATTTLNLASSTAANAIDELTAPATATTLNITGSTGLKTTKTIGTVLATINAATATGSIRLNVNDTAANLSFIGGSGSDTITFGATNTFTTADNVDGGTGSNTLGMNKAQAVGLTKAYTNIKNFNTLSINNATDNNDIINLDYFGGISL